MDDAADDDYHVGVRARIVRWVLGIVVVAAAAFAYRRATDRPFPPDTTPEGAYLRIALALAENRERDLFAYLETDAQWASFSIQEMRREANQLVRENYPPGEGDALLAATREEAALGGGPDELVFMAKRKGFTARLRRDLSGIASVEIDGDRASVVTARGTRYPFRRRENGIWGLTSFTAELVAERERAARDLDVVRRAATDYARASGRTLTFSDAGTPRPR